MDVTHSKWLLLAAAAAARGWWWAAAPNRAGKPGWKASGAGPCSSSKIVIESASCMHYNLYVTRYRTAAQMDAGCLSMLATRPHLSRNGCPLASHRRLVCMPPSNMPASMLSALWVRVALVVVYSLHFGWRGETQAAAGSPVEQTLPRRCRRHAAVGRPYLGRGPREKHRLQSLDVLFVLPRGSAHSPATNSKGYQLRRGHDIPWRSIDVRHVAKDVE